MVRARIGQAGTTLTRFASRLFAGAEVWSRSAMGRFAPTTMCSDLRLEIIKRCDPAPKGFAVQPKRWLVERTFGWLMQARRLASDYETKPSSSQALILAQSSRIMLRKLAR